jgi:hypothetical protein
MLFRVAVSLLRDHAEVLGRERAWLNAGRRDRVDGETEDEEGADESEEGLADGGGCEEERPIMWSHARGLTFSKLLPTCCEMDMAEEALELLKVGVVVC